MPRRTLEEVQGGAGFVVGLANAFIVEARERQVPFAAIDRLSRPEGRETVGKILELARRDWEGVPQNQAHAPTPPRPCPVDGERYGVFVDPGKFDPQKIAFMDREKKLDHDDMCREAASQVGERVFILRSFGRVMSRSGVRRWARENGCRVATLAEADALIGAYPELLRDDASIGILGTYQRLQGRYFFHLRRLHGLSPRTEFYLASGLYKARTRYVFVLD
ncbi:hypothetical protein EDM68_02740 [Candidatus Uhrbacteria bacterium]|nr:MAG: hypothetical protein EDM68_02740 [Candidatus Uhrbacteria bacterium]